MSNMKLTKTRFNQYMNNPHKCPFCKSENISPSNDIMEEEKGLVAVQFTRCDDCNQEWTKISQFIYIGILEDIFKNSELFKTKAILKRVKCPKCGNKELDVGEIIEGLGYNKIFSVQDVVCHKCNIEWHKFFRIEGAGKILEEDCIHDL